jgi:hypothetical protein
LDGRHSHRLFAVRDAPKDASFARVLGAPPSRGDGPALG